MKISLRTLVFIYCFIISSIFAQNSKNDFFPLNVGNSFEYKYLSHEDLYYWDFTQLNKITIDSGKVIFSITSYTENDSLRNWIVTETDSISEIVMNLTGADTNYNPIYDTAYSKGNYSLQFGIQEVKADSGKLISDSYIGIWHSPVTWDGWSSSISDTAEYLYRYSANPITKIISNSLYGFCFYFDSLVFTKDVGLVKAYSSISKGPNVPYYYSWQATLVNYNITGINKNNSTEIIKDYSLFQNYPNPFNPTTVINYQIPKDGFVSLKVYDLLGKEVKTLISGHKNPGSYSANFDASNLASGIYFYRLRAGNFISTKKMMLLK